MGILKKKIKPNHLAVPGKFIFSHKCMMCGFPVREHPSKLGLVKTAIVHKLINS